jgi:hypothetical protein
MEFPYIWLSDLKFVERRKSNFFFQHINFAAQFAAPSYMLPGAAAPLEPSTYAPGYNVAEMK